MALRVTVKFLGMSLQWPLRDGDRIDFHDGATCVGSISGASAVAILHQQVAAAQLLATIAEELRQSIAELDAPVPTPPALPARPPLAKIPHDVRTARRTARRRRNSA